MERTIQCPECVGVGYNPRTITTLGRRVECHECDGLGAIPDRRVQPEPMVPLRLVEEIANKQHLLFSKWRHGEPMMDAIEALDAAIRAAREGAR